ncbi:hypothetical protein AFLA_014086 [Aspergillus flavus NRRL3357]|nr:hypothetical protein AFLA_014086 [Aspergillus flavus NRRL3357]
MVNITFSIIWLVASILIILGISLGSRNTWSIRIIMSLEQKVGPRVRQCLLLSRILFCVGLGLQIAGGCLEGSDSASDVTIGVKLVKAGYSIVVAFVAWLNSVRPALDGTIWPAQSLQFY